MKTITAQDPWTQHSSNADLAARAITFQQHYGEGKSATYHDVREQVIRMASTLRRSFHWGAEFEQHIKDEADLQRLIFDKVYPHIEKAGFPKSGTPAFAEALHAFEQQAMQYKRAPIAGKKA
jgi:hypothetical protein